MSGMEGGAKSVLDGMENGFCSSLPSITVFLKRLTIEISIYIYIYPSIHV